MTPKNKLREDILKQFLVIHEGPYHNQFNWHLPQFTESDPIDINKSLGLTSVNDSEKYEIAFATEPDKLPEELSHLSLNMKEDAMYPPTLRPKTTTLPKHNKYLAQGAKSTFKYMRKYKKFN